MSATIEKTVTALEAQGLTAGYGARAVVHDVNLTVAPGEVVTLLGANGAGKTTTMLALCGELPLHAGTVSFLGQPTTAPLHRRARLGFGYLADDRSVIRGLTAADNLRAGGCATEDVLAMFPELTERLSVRAGLLSGGEQQMLAVGRALARRPRVLLVDELSMGLGPKVVDRLLAAVRRAASEDGMGVLLVEQHVRKVLQYADRAYVMRRGRIVLESGAAQARSRIDEIERAYL
jgi:branched-chain amino acid transport system ATP-binding protein